MNRISRIFRAIFWVLARCVFRLRYRVDITGLDAVRDADAALIVPNHPAYVDPPLVFSFIASRLDARPMLLGSMLRNPLLGWIPKLLDALEVPDLDTQSAEGRRQVEAVINAMIDGLKHGRNHILWPAGRVYRSGKESLGGARSLTEVLRGAPEARVVAVRTRGLWGSSLSYAYTGEPPDLVGRMLRGVGLVLANLVFFMPRRRVTIEVHEFSRDELPPLERDKVNAFFEAWYNAPGEEQPTFVPYHFAFGRREHVYPPVQQREAVDLDAITDDAKQTVREVLARHMQREPGELQPDTPLDDLGLDSLERMELTTEIEQRSGFRSDELPVTVADLWAHAQGLALSGEIPPPPQKWFAPRRGDQKATLLADTIGHAFVRRALANRGDVAAFDDTSGLLTYSRLLIGAQIFAKRLARIDAPNVGVLLPSSAAADLIFLACHLAGKLPVILNWTTGRANLNHAVELMQLTHVLTSKRFIDRTGIEIDGVEMVFLEDLRQQVGKLEKLSTALRTRFRGRAIEAAVPEVLPHEPAVVLFTSGSERAPKAVPLTHTNLLSNIRSILKQFPNITREDSVIGFLPVFHSMGLVTTINLPLLIGAKVVHHPDPTDAGALAKKIAAYKPTLLAGTPTFVNYILDRVEPGDMDSVKYLVFGAEKAPPKLFERSERLAPNAASLEGYGITECAPLVSINPIDAPRPGTIGKPLPDVEVITVDPESFEPLDTSGEDAPVGMLLVHGPNVFPGYIGYEGDPPFHQYDGKRWYVTGDLARIDADGYIHFAGRLKRFLKAGGEMISLPALEEPIAQKYPATDEGPRVAVEGVETEHGRRIVLFTTEDISLEEANRILNDHGFTGVMRLTGVQHVDDIPQLGTGKTDYKQLRAMIEEPGEEK